MTPADLRAWQRGMGYTYVSAALALGVSRAAYAGWLSGKSHTTGLARDIDRRTALACAALSAGLAPIG